ncbi:MAG: hypothetical protein ABL962_16540, partial [Fimbriimonadaceae bacterium]
LLKPRQQIVCVRPPMLKTITWTKSSPQWVSIVFALFGASNIIGALVMWSGMTLPGILIGGAWFIAGWKGTPLIQTIPLSKAGTAEGLTEGVAIIKRRRLIGYFSSLSWFALGATILPRIPDSIIPTAMIGCALPTMILFSVWTFSQCPRCGDHFYFKLDRWTQTWTWNICANCGLDLKNPQE